MTGPKPSSQQHAERRRARIDSMSVAQRDSAFADSLRKEAYGESGAALRKGAAAFGEADAKAGRAKKGIVAKIKDFFGGD